MKRIIVQIRRNCFKVTQLILTVFLIGCSQSSHREDVIPIAHPNARMDWHTQEHTVKIHKDSIPVIHKRTILSYVDQPLTILLEGSSDHRNIESYIFTQGSDSVPTNGGLLGVADEEGALIMQSYDYYPGGGRYSVIEAFDLDGNRLGAMQIKMHPEYDIKQPE